jgi:hypothetical protein
VDTHSREKLDSHTLSNETTGLRLVFFLFKNEKQDSHILKEKHDNHTLRKEHKSVFLN